MIAIPIQSKTYGEKLFFIDGEDFDLIKKYSWYAIRNPYTGVFYVYAHNPVNQKKISIHQLIKKCDKNMIIDHIDGNPLNNCKSNLRICTKSENGMNRNKNKNSSCKYKGINFCNTHKKFKARIQKDKKRISLGYFKTEKEAAEAYNKAAVEYFGEFARLNIIN